MSGFERNAKCKTVHALHVFYEFINQYRELCLRKVDDTNRDDIAACERRFSRLRMSKAGLRNFMASEYDWTF